MYEQGKYMYDDMGRKIDPVWRYLVAEYSRLRIDYVLGDKSKEQELRDLWKDIKYMADNGNTRVNH